MTTDLPLDLREPEPAAAPAARRFGRYWLLKLIARGGMGEVYLGATTGIEGAERPCVVKIIRREHARDSSFLARFFDEARVQSQLQHPGVVQIFEAATDERGEPYVVVEYVEGRSLSEVRTRALQLQVRLAWPDAVAFASSIAEALTHIHERVDVRGGPLGIVHRDLSPQNIMVGYCGDVKLIDFGTARGGNRRCHTVSGVVFAKPGYVAPEVANGNTGDARVDLYALGVMLWELAAGRRFLQGDPAEHLAAVAKNGRSLPPIAQLIGAPPKLDEIVAKLTAFELGERHGSARAAMGDLIALLSKASSLPNGERGVRARIANVMATIYPAEPTRSRREFARLVAGAREIEKQGASPPSEEASSGSPSEAASDESLLAGTRYRILRRIGQGAMGSVFEAEHVDLGRRVALKVLAGERAISPDFASRFRREARALSRLSHPNLVALHDFGQATDGRLFCAMELLEGETLDRCVAREGAMPWRRAMQIGLQAARALEVAHEAGLVHRDLKPSNLFLCKDGTLKLLDFGLAKTPDEAVDGAGSDERSGFTLFGTPEYMAPEQILSGKVDARADVYALGCVLYELCTGRLPFVCESSVKVLDAKLSRDPEPPSDRAPSRGVPVEVERLILRALARRPDDRTASASAMLEAIAQALEAPAIKRRRRRGLGAAVLAACLAAGLALIGWGATRRYPDRFEAALGRLVRAPATVAFAVPAVLPASEAAASEPARRDAPASGEVQRPAGSATADAPPPPANEASGPAPVRPEPDPSTLEPRAAGAQAPAAETSPEAATPAGTATRVATGAATGGAMGADFATQAQRAVIARDWNAAIRISREWLAHEPGRAPRLLLARLLAHTGNCREARATLEEGFGDKPADAEVKSLVAFCKLPWPPVQAKPPARGKGAKTRVARATPQPGKP
jgi:serine/threonine-protein kinase